MDRRRFIVQTAAAMTGLAMMPSPGPFHNTSHAAVRRRIPLIHLTDLYHPPQDPDDHCDLATVVALPAYDLRGVILDVTQRFLEPAPAGFDIRRDPGFLPVRQLARITGRTIPVAAGPQVPLQDPLDTARDRPADEQEGIDLLLDLLRASDEPVVLSVVGSARIVAAAFNRDPALLRAQTAAILLNAGSTGGPKQEWNVGLDPHAYTRVMGSGLPLRWYPCSTESGAFHPDHERGTYWKGEHRTLFGSLAPAMRAWFYTALCDPEGAVDPGGSFTPDQERLWEKMLEGSRNMWSTGSLVMGAGMALAQTAGGWRFVDGRGEGAERVWQWRMDPVDLEVGEGARIGWTPAEAGRPATLFGRERGRGYGEAMAGALGALLGSIAPQE